MKNFNEGVNILKKTQKVYINSFDIFICIIFFFINLFDNLNYMIVTVPNTTVSKLELEKTYCIDYKAFSNEKFTEYLVYEL